MQQWKEDGQPPEALGFLFQPYKYDSIKTGHCHFALGLWDGMACACNSIIHQDPEIGDPDLWSAHLSQPPDGVRRLVSASECLSQSNL